MNFRADDDSDHSIGSDDAVSVAASLMSGTTGISLHPMRHCFERMLERDVDLDEMRLTKKYGKRTWVGKKNTECRIGWRIVVPVRELQLPGYCTETELTCWRNPITGMWKASCGAQYSLRHYSKLTSRGVVCLGVGIDSSFLEIACGIELDTYYNYSFVSIIFEAQRPPRLTSFMASSPSQPRCNPFEAGNRELHITRPCRPGPQRWVSLFSDAGQSSSDFGRSELRTSYEQHLTSVLNLWERVVVEPLSNSLFGRFAGNLSGLWQKPKRNRLVAILHWNGSKCPYHAFEDLEPSTHSMLNANDWQDNGQSTLRNSSHDHQALDRHSAMKHQTALHSGVRSDMLFFIQVSPEEMFCELGVGQFLRRDKIHFRRGDCEPNNVGPSSLLNHIFSLSADGKDLCSLSTGQGKATVAFSRKQQITEFVHAVSEDACSVDVAAAMSVVSRELFLQYELHNLAREGLAEEAANLLMNDSEELLQLHSFADDGLTPLHVAAREGHAGVASVLLDHCAKVNQRRLGHRSTPLHYAVQYQHVNVVEMLLKHGARADRKAWDHLHRSFAAKQVCAASHRSLEQLLLQADPEFAVLGDSESPWPMHVKRTSNHYKRRADCWRKGGSWL